MYSLIYSSMLAASLLFSAETTVELKITNISVAEGTVRIAVFANEADFEADKNAVFADAIALTSRQTIRLEVDIDDSTTYGIGLYHDVNNNGKLDTNVMGIPSEPYAFSNNPAAKWKAPTFADIAFVPKNVSGRTLDLKLMRWGER